MDTETRIPDSRARILSEARSLFLEAGFAETSMQDIAGASGLTKAALYYHFRDKYELFTTMALLELECINQGLEGIFASENALREQLVDAGTRSAPLSGNGCVASDRGGFLTYDMIDVSTGPLCITPLAHQALLAGKSNAGVAATRLTASPLVAPLQELPPHTNPLPQHDIRLPSTFRERGWV